VKCFPIRRNVVIFKRDGMISFFQGWYRLLVVKEADNWYLEPIFIWSWEPENSKLPVNRKSGIMSPESCGAESWRQDSQVSCNEHETHAFQQVHTPHMAFLTLKERSHSWLHSKLDSPGWRVSKSSEGERVSCELPVSCLWTASRVWVLNCTAAESWLVS